MSPEAEHILDWFHVSMKLTVLDQYARGLVPCDQMLSEQIRDKIERLKWSLWHGNLSKAFYKIDDLESLLYNFEETYPKLGQLLKAVEEFRTYIVNNSRLIPNYSVSAWLLCRRFFDPPSVLLAFQRSCHSFLSPDCVLAKVFLSW